MKDSVPVLLVIVMLCGCATEDIARETATVFNTDTAKALSQYGDTLKKKRTPVEFDSGEKADSCESYARLATKSTLKEGIANQYRKSEYLVCDLLAIVGNRRVMTNDIDKNATHGTALTTRLDLRSFPSSLFQMLDENKHTLAQLDAKAIKTTQTSASSENMEWLFRLELVAIVDADKNGKSDWVLELLDESKSGNYRNYQILIAYNVTANGAIQAKPYQHSIYQHRK